MNLRDVTSCLDCKFFIHIAHCGCHCNDEDCCLMTLDNYGQYGLENKTCDNFQEGRSNFNYITNSQYEKLIKRRSQDDHENYMSADEVKEYFEYLKSEREDTGQ